MSKDIVHTAVGIVLRLDHKILIAERPAGKSFEGYWEFPGGKIERYETAEEAVVREFQEEINITPTEFALLKIIEHEYSDKIVSLATFLIRKFSGKPEGREGQTIAWIHEHELKNYRFLPANQAILSALFDGVLAGDS